MLQRIVLRDPDTNRWLDLSSPLAVAATRRLEEVSELLAATEARVNTESLFAAGFVSYEAAPAFDTACATVPAGTLPLLCLGLFEAASTLDALPAADIDRLPGLDWKLTTSRQHYLDNIARIRAEIAAGNTYQVNYTIRATAESVDDAWLLFLGIARDAPYAAYIETDDHAIVSASPELFFRLDGERLVSRPMKGTASRGLSAAADEQRRAQFAASAKDRAENVMIADMLRNDMGRIAHPGSVVAESLFDIEKYATVWQATSTISAQTGASVADIFAALFPCASITGAPKIASMRLITELERQPRGIYTGAIGYIAPGRRAQFSVGIRTALVDRQRKVAEYGVGGGIVWDSDAEAEYAECLTKGRILHHVAPSPDFRLFETLRLRRASGYDFLEEHMERLLGSARYFDFAAEERNIRGALQAFAETQGNEDRRVRLTLDRDGNIDISSTELPVWHGAVRVRLASQPVDPGNVLLYHKTTDRQVYEKALRDLAGCDDVLLWNRDGLLTEATIANLALRIDDKLYTPPVACGLLPGTCRAAMLARGELAERPLHKDDLAAASAIYLLNAVRGLYRATLVTDT